jgi:hypothetical protein
MVPFFLCCFVGQNSIEFIERAVSSIDKRLPVWKDKPSFACGFDSIF